MNDTTDGDGEDMPPLQKVMQLIDELDDVTNTGQLREALKHPVKQLGMFDIAVLEEFLMERTGFSQPTISKLIKEARDYIEGFGYLHSVDDVVRAYSEWLAGEYKAVISCGSGLYHYNDITGSFEFTSIEELERHILSTFEGLPVLQREGAARLVLKRIRLSHANEAFFDDARAGLNLGDGFLTLGEDGAPVLLPHSPDHKARVHVNVDYDGDASFEWLEAALRVTLPLQLLRDALQEIAAAILFNIRPSKDSVRRMFLLHGARNSGKSTLIGMLQTLLPSDVVGAVPPGDWGDANYRAALENIVLNCVTELGGNTRIGGEHMKKIVSCEPIMIKRMRRDAVAITPRAWHLLATNELPKIIDTTDAFERRTLVITFPVSLTDEQIDTSFMERLKADPNAVIAWAITGAKRLRDNGRFTLPDGHLEAAAEMQFGNDLPMLFAHTQVRQVPGARITTVALRAALKAFARSRDVDPITMHDGAIRRVAEVMYKRYGATHHKSTGAPFYQGVALISPAPPEDGGPTEVEFNDDF